LADFFDLYICIVETDLRVQRFYILCYVSYNREKSKGGGVVSMVGISTVYNKRIADRLLRKLAEEICKILTSKACPWLNAGNDERMRRYELG
jgi:hypothetical protein